ncbi:MAG: hypothetical protein S4CHLAM6_14420 [Chlamydiae bacterium]|nr:hypothetical protein [Chlamydiota bacterium]
MTTYSNDLSPRSQNLLSMQWLKNPRDKDPAEVSVTYDGNSSFEIKCTSGHKTFKINLQRNPTSRTDLDRIYAQFEGSMEISAGPLFAEENVRVREGETSFQLKIFTVGRSSDEPMVLFFEKDS